VKEIIAGTTVGELALHYLDRNQIPVPKVLSKFDLRRPCRASNPSCSLRGLTPEEAGYVDICEMIEIGGDRVTVLLLGPDGAGVKTRTATIVLRGATQNHLDDLERTVDDGVASLKALLKDRSTSGARGRRYGAGASSSGGLVRYEFARTCTACRVPVRVCFRGHSAHAAENAHGRERDCGAVTDEA